MVLTRFTWPHGGRSVFVSGSFTEWREHFPMALMEGSLTDFQTTRNLAPGYHQYKFLVDGIWQHDEQQPFVTDEFGIVNNIILVIEQPVPSVLCPGTATVGTVMAVDNGAHQPVASLSGHAQQDPLVRIPDTDIDVSRHLLSMLLSRYTAYELLPESGKVSALDIKLPVKRAFHIMYEEGLSVVPLWDEFQGQFSGMLTASDFIMILRELHASGSMLTSEELEIHSIAAWKDWKLRFRGDSNRFQRNLIQAGPDESLKDVALRLVQNKICALPIVHSSTQDGSSQQLLHLACLPEILKYICRHFRHSPGLVPFLHQPIYGIPIGTWVPEIGRASRLPLTMLRPNTSLSTGLNVLIEGQISSIPIVDENGSLLDVYSRSDITTLASGGSYTHIQLDQTSMHQALQLGQQVNGVNNGPRRCHTCLRSDTLHEVMERLSDPEVRRLVVVEPSTQRVEGIISLNDVFNFILG